MQLLVREAVAQFLVDRVGADVTTDAERVAEQLFGRLEAVGPGVVHALCVAQPCLER